MFVHDALLEHVRSGDTEVEFTKAREYLAKLLEDISEDELAVLDLNSNKKSTNDLSNGVVVNGETSSIKSSQNSEKEVVENGSEISIKTDDLNSEQSKSSTRDLNENSNNSTSNNFNSNNSNSNNSNNSNSNMNSEEQKEVLVNGDESEGVYDLAPRSTDTYSKKMQAYNNLNDQEKEEIRRYVVILSSFCS